MAMDRKRLRATVLFTLLLITQAMYIPAIKTAKHEMKNMAREVLRYLQNESTCVHNDPMAVHSIGCIKELKNDTSDCERISTFGTYFTEAIELDIHTLVTEQLKAINQYIQSFQRKVCKAVPTVKSCEVAFKENDGDYEKLCKTISLLELFTQW